MSFRDLESGPRVIGHASKQQPRQRREEESVFERCIKANIQEMQDSIRKASSQLEHAQRSFLSRRLVESLDKFLERSRDLSQETEKHFRDWTVHLAGEPTERHRKKFSYEKLQKAFEEEIIHLKDVARRAVAAQQEAGHADGRLGAPAMMECQSICGEQGSSICGDGVEHGLLDDSDSGEACRLISLHEDATIRNRIAQEREEGIRRIQSQVSEVNQIFRDLASIVQEQGQQFDSIESQAETASSTTKQAVQELRKAVDRQRGSRERLCCMLAVALLLLCLVVLPHMHMLELHHVAGASAGVGAGATAGAGAMPGSSPALPPPPAGWRSVASASSAGAGRAAAGGGSGAEPMPVIVSVTGRPVS